MNSHSLNACKPASTTALYVRGRSKFLTGISQFDDLIFPPHTLSNHRGRHVSSFCDVVIRLLYRRPSRMNRNRTYMVCTMWFGATNPRHSTRWSFLTVFPGVIWSFSEVFSNRYHTMTDVCTAALLPTKPSSDGDSGFKHGFGTEASLPLTQSSPTVTYDTTRLCCIVDTLWDCHIYADAVRALYVSPFMNA